MTSPPTWLAEMANRLASEIYAADILAPIGCHYYFHKENEQWEVTLFASSTEIVGGSLDGRQTSSKFCVDLQGVQSVFSELTRFYWQALSFGEDDELGPHISLEGIYEENRVWVRILSQAPEGFEPGRQLQAYELRLEDVW